jgi:hypothetical protein
MRRRVETGPGRLSGYSDSKTEENVQLKKKQYFNLWAPKKEQLTRK